MILPKKRPFGHRAMIFSEFALLSAPKRYDKLSVLTRKGSEFAIRSERESTFPLDASGKKSKRSCVPGRRHGRFRLRLWPLREDWPDTQLRTGPARRGLAGNGATPPGGIGVVEGQEATKQERKERNKRCNSKEYASAYRHTTIVCLTRPSVGSSTRPGARVRRSWGRYPCRRASNVSR